MMLSGRGQRTFAGTCVRVSIVTAEPPIPELVIRPSGLRWRGDSVSFFKDAELGDTDDALEFFESNQFVSHGGGGLLTVELFVDPRNRLRRGEESGEREDDHAVSERLQLFERQERRLSAF